MKARDLRRVLERKPLHYRRGRQTGSHKTLVSNDGYPSLLWAFHDAQTLPPGLVRKILTEDVGLTDEEAIRLL